MNIEYFKETWSRASPAVLVASSPSPTTLLGFFLELLRSHVVGIGEPLQPPLLPHFLGEDQVPGFFEEAPKENLLPDCRHVLPEFLAIG